MLTDNQKQYIQLTESDDVYTAFIECIYMYSENISIYGFGEYTFAEYVENMCYDIEFEDTDDKESFDSLVEEWDEDLTEIAKDYEDEE